MRPRTKTSLIAITAMAGIALAGCTPQEPTVLPEAVLERAGTSALDDDETVKALRALDVAMSMAWNSGDFTIAPLTEALTPAAIESQYETYFSFTFRDYEPFVYVGPGVWSPIAVTAVGEKIEVEVCLAKQDRTITSGDAVTSLDLTTGRHFTYVLKVAEDGRYEVDRTSDTQEECDASDAEVVTFDPVPIAPEKITEGMIRAPAEQE